MSVLAQAVANFEARPRRQVEVPEWSADPAKPVTLYFRTPSPKVLSRVQREAAGDKIKEAALLVCMVVTDDKDVRQFTDADHTELMIRTDPMGIARVYAAITAEARIDVVDAEKN